MRPIFVTREVLLLGPFGDEYRKKMKGREALEKKTELQKRAVELQRMKDEKVVKKK
jgi:hypothetical protein